MKELSDCRVLLVDDAKANLDILVEGLKSDHKLSLALNGEMALEVAARTPPDLVLLDIVMPGLDANAILHPAQAVGGDLYEVLRTPGGNLVAVMGDVSGKGIPAALFMAVTMTLVRALAPDSRTPAEILRRVSDALATQNPRNLFVTILCAIYDVRTGRLDYASAGHPPPVLIREGKAEFLPLEPDMAAGILAG